MSRPTLALGLLVGAAALPILTVAGGVGWFIEAPALLVAAVAGYAAGAWLPRVPAATGVAVTVVALVVANQLNGDDYHWLDDLAFFAVFCAGPALAGAAVTARAQQVQRLERLRAELAEQQQVEVAAVRLEAKSRVESQVHAALAERIAGIALRADGARRSGDVGALPVLEHEARDVLDQLRAALGSLRDEAPGPAPEPTAPSREDERTAVDLLVPGALAAAIATEIALTSDAHGPWWANAIAATAVVGPLTVRRAYPISAAALTCALGVGMSLLLTPISDLVTGVALLATVFYSVGAWTRSWWWLVGWVVTALGGVAVEVAGDGENVPMLLCSIGALALGRVAAGWQARSQLVYDSLVAGASGFLLKDAPGDRLVSGVRAVARGEELLAPSITRRLIEEFTRAGRDGPPPGYDDLTEREAEVLALVARGRSNAEIAAHLVVSVQTVKTHVAHVLQKLGLRDRLQAVVLAYEHGIVRPGEVG